MTTKTTTTIAPEFKSVAEMKGTTTAAVFSLLLAASRRSDKSAIIPTLREALKDRLGHKELMTPMAVKYHLTWGIERGLIETRGNFQTGVKGQPPKMYALTRKGLSFAAPKAAVKTKKAPKAAVKAAPEAAPVAQAA